MGTPKQNAANPRNSLHSTGPNTVLGKFNSSRNAVKHGMTAGRKGRAAIKADEFAEGRTAEFVEILKPTNAIGRDAAERAALASVQVKHAAEEFNALLQEHKERARSVWDLDRHAEAADLASQLHSKPTQIVGKLLKLRHGAEHLIHLWHGVQSVVLKTGDLDEDDRSFVLDLMGYDRIFRKGAFPFEPPPETVDRKAFILKMIGKQISDLNELITHELMPLDLEKRTRAVQGQHLNIDKDFTRIMRYQREATKRLYQAMNDVYHQAPPCPPNREPKPKTRHSKPFVLNPTLPPHSPLHDSVAEAEIALAIEVATKDQLRSPRLLDGLPLADPDLIDERLMSFETVMPLPGTPRELLRQRGYIQTLLQLEASAWTEAERELVKKYCPMLR